MLFTSPTWIKVVFLSFFKYEIQRISNQIQAHEIIEALETKQKDKLPVTPVGKVWLFFSLKFIQSYLRCVNQHDNPAYSYTNRSVCRDISKRVNSHPVTRKRKTAIPVVHQNIDMFEQLMLAIIFLSYSNFATKSSLWQQMLANKYPW